MKQSTTTVHANPQSVAELIERLSTITGGIPIYPIKHDMTPDAVIQRLKKNLQYNNSPSISSISVGIDDAKIILQLLEKNNVEE